jgi:D-inositol-3-phosphate glycosyltransferase
MDRAMAYHDWWVAKHLQSRPTSYDVAHCWPGATLHTARAALSLGIPSLREAPNTHTADAYEVVGRLCGELGLVLPKGHSHRRNPGRLKRDEAEYAAASHVLAPSDHVMKTFTDRGFSSEKMLRHHYGFDPKAFAPRAAPRRGPLHAVFIGTIGPRKGLHVALEAWRRAGAPGRARFSIYGRIVNGYEPIIEPYLSLPGVTLHGFTEDAAAAFRAANALILPSFEEGSALVTYEAQGCGVVPLVSDASGARCTHNVTGLTHRAGDVDQLAGHIALLVDQPELLRSMRASVIRHRDRLTWAAAAERLEDCYQLARRPWLEDSSLSESVAA